MRFRPHHVLIALWALSLHEPIDAQDEEASTNMPLMPPPTSTSPPPSETPTLAPSPNPPSRTTTPPPSTTPRRTPESPTPSPPSTREPAQQPPASPIAPQALPNEEPAPDPATPSPPAPVDSPPASTPKEKPPVETKTPAPSAKKEEKEKAPEVAPSPGTVPPGTPTSPPPTAPLPNAAPKKATDTPPMSPARQNKDQEPTPSLSTKSKSKTSLPSWLVPTVIGGVVVAVALFVLVGIRNNRNKYEDDNHDESTDPTNDNFIAPGTDTLAPKRGVSSVRGSMVPQSTGYVSSAQLPGPPGARGPYYGGQTAIGYQGAQTYSKPQYSGPTSTSGQFSGTSPPGGPHYERLSRNSTSAYSRAPSYHQNGYDVPAQNPYGEPAARQYNAHPSQSYDQSHAPPNRSGQPPHDVYATQNPQNPAAIGVTL